MKYHIIFQKCRFFLNVFIMDLTPVIVLQDSLCPKKLHCFWYFPPGCQWLALFTWHRFLSSFWGTSVWSACRHTSSTLRCFSPTWSAGEQLKEWRRRQDRKGPLWKRLCFNFPPVFQYYFHMWRLFRDTRLEMNLRRCLRNKCNADPWLRSSHVCKAVCICAAYYTPTSLKVDKHNCAENGRKAKIT